MWSYDMYNVRNIWSMETIIYFDVLQYDNHGTIGYNLIGK